MVKRIAIVGAGVALLAALLTVGGKTSSYVSTLWTQTSERVQELESTEFMVERLHTMIKDLDPEIHDVQLKIAKEEHEVDELQARLSGMEERLAKGKADILRMKGDLERSDNVFVYVGKSYARNEVETDLERRFEVYKSQETTGDQLREIVAARETSLGAAREKLGVMQSQKEQLKVDLEQLKAQMEMLKVKQAASEIAVDDSALSDAKNLRDTIKGRLSVAEKMIAADGRVEGEIQLDEPAPTGDILEQVTRHFDAPLANEDVAIQLD